MSAIEQCFPMLLFTLLFKVVLLKFPVFALNPRVLIISEQYFDPNSSSFLLFLPFFVFAVSFNSWAGRENMKAKFKAFHGNCGWLIISVV